MIHRVTTHDTWHCAAGEADFEIRVECDEDDAQPLIDAISQVITDYEDAQR